MRKNLRPRPNGLKPGQTIATYQPACRNIICPAFASYDQTIATFSTTYPKNMQHVAGVWRPCFDIMDIENRTSAHAWAQHCAMNLAKRLQHINPAYRNIVGPAFASSEEFDQFQI